MTDYFEPHKHSTYDPHYSQHHGHGQDYASPSYSHTLSYADPPDENAMRRVPTNEYESHQYESQQSHDASADTRSWVYSTQMNPPPPPTISVVDGPTSFHGPRPLPEPHHYRAQQAQQQHYQQDQHQQQYQHHPVRRPVQYADTIDDDETDDYMPGGPGPQAPGRNVQFGYQSDGVGPVRPVVAGPSNLPHHQPPPVVPIGLPDPASPPPLRRGNKSFVGGFFSGLKRLPSKMFGGSGGGGKGGKEKGKLVRQPTFGTEATNATGKFTTGNTLPRYLSNPSIGPSNPQFAHRLSMAVANGSVPADATPSAFQIRPTLAERQYPAVVVTAPSDGIVSAEQADFYEEEEPIDNQTEQLDHAHDPIRRQQTPMERTTVMMYGNESQAPTITQTAPSLIPTIPTILTPGPVRPITSPPTRSPTPRVSYPAELPTRASLQSQAHSGPPPPIVPLTAVVEVEASPPSRRQPTPHPPPATVQPTMAALPMQPLLRPQDLVSPSATSRYTVTTATSYYDPSFASHLSPMEKFFKGLYNLPWVAQGRVTIDYRPGDTPRAKGKIRGLKKPKSSWYQAVLSRSRRNSLAVIDAANGGNDTKANRILSPSVGTSGILSSLGSPISRRSGRSSTNRYYSSSKPKHRKRRRNTASSSAEGHHHHHHHGRSSSPIIPNVYPYTVPPYPPYTYPYVPYPGMAMPPEATSKRYDSMSGASPTSTSPRGPRAARTRRKTKQRYPQGYVPYQPMAMPPPVPPLPMNMNMNSNGVNGMNMPAMPLTMPYYISPSPPHSQDSDGVAAGGSGGGGATGGAPMMGISGYNHLGQPQFSPVFMPYVPAAAYQPHVQTHGHGHGHGYSRRHEPSNAMVSPPVTPERQSARAHV